MTQPKNTSTPSGSSPPSYAAAFGRGGTTSSGAAGVGAPTAPLNVNKTSKKEGEEDSSDGKPLNINLEVSI